LNRYARHTVLAWFGPEGQARLRQSSILVVGCGGTGCACLAFLARAGVGRIVIADRDVVGLTDLHRQILYDEKDAQQLTLKTAAAMDELRGANGECDIRALPVGFSSANAAALVRDVDLIVDCSDNLETRMLINDVCLKHSIPWVHGACTGTAGMVIPFPAAGEACYRCVVDHIPSGADSAGAARGVFGPAAGMVGSLEAGEAIKMLTAPRSVCSKIIYFDSFSCAYETISVRRRKNCPACVQGVYEFLDGDAVRRDSLDSESRTALLSLSAPFDLGMIGNRLAEHHAVVDLGGVLRVTTPEVEFLLLADGTAVVRGVQDLGQARSVLRNLLKG
jgi:molybdopterin/thiamine biosynthesis adenylyltransferase